MGLNNEGADIHVPAWNIGDFVMHSEHGKCQVIATVMSGPYPVYMLKKPGRIDAIRAVATMLEDAN